MRMDEASLMVGDKENQLLRPISDGCGSVQDYRGSVDISAQPPTMQGQMRIDYGPGCVGFDPVYNWSAQKQS